LVKIGNQPNNKTLIKKIFSHFELTYNANVVQYSQQERRCNLKIDKSLCL
jgi:hypothetical protein